MAVAPSVSGQGIDNTVIMDYLSAAYSSRKLYDTPTYGIAFYHQSTFDDLLVDGLSATIGIRYDYERASTDYLSFKDTEEESKELDAFYSKLNSARLHLNLPCNICFPLPGLSTPL